VTSFFEFLEGVSRDGLFFVGVFVIVAQSDFIIVSETVGHDEILLNSSWQDRVAAIVDMLTNNIDTSRSSYVEF